MKWFKLVGATEEPIKEDWEHKEPQLFSKLQFPWNKRPRDFSNGEPIIVYAVGDRVLIATQTVEGPPKLAERRGSVGSPEHRWPHSIPVVTHYYCSPLKSAPKLREVAPDFAKRYAGKFREGSHWRIDDAEYAELAAAIEEEGRPFRPGANPKS
jgi:hypothetical protein